MSNVPICTVCKGPRKQLQARNSKLVPGMTLLLCNDCVAEKREPRFAIILKARAEGPAAVEEYLKKRRYVGEEILLSEIL